MRLDIAFLEQDNIRGALAWAVSSGEVRLGLELGAAMELFWVLEDPREGMRWFDRLLERPKSRNMPAEVRGHALRSYGSCAHIGGDLKLAERHPEDDRFLLRRDLRATHYEVDERRGGSSVGSGAQTPLTPQEGSYT